MTIVFEIEERNTMKARNNFRSERTDHILEGTRIEFRRLRVYTHDKLDK